MIKAIIFDMDGVILNTEMCHFEAWKKLFRPYQVTLTWEMYVDKVQVQGRKRAILNVLGEISEAKILELSTEKEKYYFEAVSNRQEVIYEDCLEWIQWARKKGIPMVVASSSKSAPKLLTLLGLVDFFVGVYIGSKVKDGEPNPEVFLKAVDATGVKADECLIFEDAYNGIRAGIEAGCQVIAIDREDTLKLEDTDVPKYKDFRELGSSLF